jgi:protein AroM
MRPKKVGALIIGQLPRPDLIGPLAQWLPSGCQLLSAGALDGLEKDALPDEVAAAYPLTTRLRDGHLVQLPETFIAPRLQQALDKLEAAGAAASLLLCAGTFAALHGRRPLFKPFAIGRAMLKQLGWHAIGFITPIAAQEQPVRQRWLAAGFQATVWTADLASQDESFDQELRQKIRDHRLECIVLDYVGHPPSLVARLQEAAGRPVLDLGQLAMASLASSL